MKGLLLDTCALSEKLQKNPDAGFVKWLDAQDVDELYVSVISVGEISKGIELLPDSKKKTLLDQWFTKQFLPFFDGRILHFKREEAIKWGKLFASCQLKGDKPPAIDCLIAATALTNNMAIVTRNERDFRAFEVEVINPWDALP
jgi:predicted nucleic acid-binding protein